MTVSITFWTCFLFLHHELGLCEAGECNRSNGTCPAVSLQDELVMMQQRVQMSRTAMTYSIDGSGFDVQSLSCIPSKSWAIAIFVAALFVVACVASRGIAPESTKEADRLRAIALLEESVPERVALLDNAKFLCIVLVIWVHSVYAVSEQHYTKDYNMFGQAMWFHIPLFALISGMVSRKPISIAGVRRFLESTVVPLLLYCLVLTPLLTGLLLNAEMVSQDSIWSRMKATMQHPGEALLSEIYPVWYIRCLVLWRLQAWAFDVFPSSVQMLLVLSIGIAATYTTSLEFEESMYTQPLLKCAYCAPFYFTGRIFCDQILTWTKSPLRPATMLFGYAMFASMIICAMSLKWDIVMKHHWGFIPPFTDYHPSLTPGCPADVLLLWSRYLADLVLRGFMAFMFLALCVPRQTTFFTENGARTIYPFLLQMYVLAALAHGLARMADGAPMGRHAYAYVEKSPLVLLPSALLMSFVLGWLLSSSIFRFTFGWVFEPFWCLRSLRSWIYRAIK